MNANTVMFWNNPEEFFLMTDQYWMLESISKYLEITTAKFGIFYW